MSYIFKGKIALITGSARGIGKSILFELAKCGCKVILHCCRCTRDVEKSIKELKAINADFISLHADLTNEKEVKKLFQSIQRKYGKLDILINNVGNYLKKDLKDLTIKEWHEIIDSNLNSTYYCTYYGLPLLRKSKKGRIINIGYAGIGQIVAKPRILPYQIAKTGILLLTKGYALTEAKNKISVNMISPGVMENSIHCPKKEIPLKKKGSLKNFSEFIVDIIKRDYITGTHIEYSGGFNL